MVSLLNRISSTIISGLQSKRPNNAVIVPPSKQWAGDFAQDLPLNRFYDYYHGWANVKGSLNSIHRRFMGTGIEIQSEDTALTKLLEIWCEVVNFKQKLKDFTLDALITGNGFFELQFDDEGKLANIEHIPSYTMWRIFRNEFGHVLEYAQLVEGRKHSLAPKYILHFAINNPERDGFGKSEIYSIAVPQKVSGKVDENGNTINPDRYIRSILDSDALLRFAHIETLVKHAKSQVFVTVTEKDRERQKEIEKDINNSWSDKWIHVTNSEVKAAEASISPNAKFKEYGEDIKTQIDLASGFPSQVVSNAGSMGFASSQTPVNEMMHRISDMRDEAIEKIRDGIFKILAEQWGFDFTETKPTLVFKEFIEKITFEQFTKAPLEKMADTEIRNNLKKFGFDLDDAEWEKFQKEQEQKEIELQKQGISLDDKRPDIEKDSPKPDPSKISEFQHEISAIVRKELKEVLTQNFSGVGNPDNGELETDPPEITDPQVEERIKDVKKDTSEKPEVPKNS